MKIYNNLEEGRKGMKELEVMTADEALFHLEQEKPGEEEERKYEEELAERKRRWLEGPDKSWGKDRLASDGFTVIKWNRW